MLLQKEQKRPLVYYLRQAALLDENQINFLMAQRNQSEAKVRFHQIAIQQGFIKQQTIDFLVRNLLVKTMRKIDSSNLAQAELKKANLSHSSLRLANLTGANLEKAILQQVDFECACLSEVNLTDAHLEGSSFRKANLRSADLRDGYLVNVCFEGADLRNTKLQGANLKGAYYDSETVFDLEFDPTKIGMQSH